MSVVPPGVTFCPWASLQMDQFHDFLTLSLQICGCWSKGAGSEQSVTGTTGNVGLSIQVAIQVYARFQWPCKTKHYTLRDTCEGKREGEKQAEHVHLTVGAQVLPDPFSFLSWACTWCTFPLSTSHVSNFRVVLAPAWWPAILLLSCAWCIRTQGWMEKLESGCDWEMQTFPLEENEAETRCELLQWDCNVP